MSPMFRCCVLLTLLMLVFACRKELERPQWDTQVLMPLVKTSLSIKDILKDTTSYRIASDSSIVLVYKQQLDSFSLDVLDTFSVAPFHRKVGLSSLVLQSDTIHQSITLGQVARQLTQSSDLLSRLLGYAILNSQDSTLDIPDLSHLSSPAVPIDINQWFQSAVLTSGTLEIKITNNLPVGIKNLQFQLNNKTLEPKLVADVTFADIPSRSTQTIQTDLSGKKVEGNLEASIPNIDIVGKKKVLIDTNAALIMQISIRDIKVSEAHAIFPAQNVIEDRKEVPLGNTNGLELKKTILKKAKVKIEVYSTLPDTLFFSYSLPTAISPDNKSFLAEEFVPPGISNSTGPTFVKEYDFTGYTLDLTGKPGHDTINCFYSDLTGRIKQSLSPIFLTLSDSLDITITMQDILPQYIEGYIEKDTMFSGEVPFNVFGSMKGGTLNFEKVNIAVSLKNGFGIDGSITAEKIETKNDKGQTVLLKDEALIGVAKPIAGATKNPYQPANTQLGTELASPLLSIFPTKVSYSFKVHAGSGVKQYDRFAYDFSSLKPSLDISVPLSLMAGGIVLSDTVAVSPTFSDAIRNGTLTLIADNGFPLSAVLSMYFMDASGTITDSLTNPQAIREAAIDPVSSKVKIRETTKISYVIDEARLHNIASASRLLFKVLFDTKPAGAMVKIYEDYTINFKIVGDIAYRVH